MALDHYLCVRFNPTRGVHHVAPPWHEVDAPGTVREPPEDTVITQSHVASLTTQDRSNRGHRHCVRSAVGQALMPLRSHRSDRLPEYPLRP